MPSCHLHPAKKADLLTKRLLARCLLKESNNDYLFIKFIRSMEVTITSENFKSYLNGDQPLVVDLWATWCGPCRAIAPIISELANEYDGKIVVGKCDVEENDEIAAEFGVRNIPTILFFKDGKLVDKMVGAANKSKFDEKFKALL